MLLKTNSSLIDLLQVAMLSRSGANIKLFSNSQVELTTLHCESEDVAKAAVVSLSMHKRLAHRNRGEYDIVEWSKMHTDAKEYVEENKQD